MDQRSTSNSPGELRRDGGPSRSRIGRLAPGRSPGCRLGSLVNGGGHGYPSPQQGLTIFHGHMAATEMQETTGFPGNSEECVTSGGKRGYIYTKTVTLREARCFPGCLAAPTCLADQR